MSAQEHITASYQLEANVDHNQIFIVDCAPCRMPSRSVLLASHSSPPGSDQVWIPVELLALACLGVTLAAARCAECSAGI